MNRQESQRRQVTHVLMAPTLVCEGADMNEGQLMGDLELDSKQLEAESWSQVVDSKFLQQQNKDVVKRQDVIYGEKPASSFFTHCRWLLEIGAWIWEASGQQIGALTWFPQKPKFNS